MRKPFSQQEYKKSNTRAIKEATEYFLQIGWAIEVPPEKPGRKWDFLTSYDHKLYKVEVEQKHNWKSIQWPNYFRYVHVPARKGEYGTDGHPDYYILFNDTWETFAGASMKNIMSCPIIYKDCPKVGTTNEDFFSVDPSIFRFFEKKNGVWIRQ